MNHKRDTALIPRYKSTTFIIVHSYPQRCISGQPEVGSVDSARHDSMLTPIVESWQSLFLPISGAGSAFSLPALRVQSILNAQHLYGSRPLYSWRSCNTPCRGLHTGCCFRNGSDACSGQKLLRITALDGTDNFRPLADSRRVAAGCGLEEFTTTEAAVNDSVCAVVLAAAAALASPSSSIFTLLAATMASRSVCIC